MTTTVDIHGRIKYKTLDQKTLFSSLLLYCKSIEKLRTSPAAAISCDNR